MFAQGLLMIIIGVWLLFQTVGGDLPGRLMSYAVLSSRGGGSDG